MPLNEIESLSRLAGSPALPTAITTRPQLASSPAIAVFTSGEFATDIPILRGEIGEHGAERPGEVFQAGIAGSADFRRAVRGRCSGGERQQRIRCRRIAIDGDGIKSIF